MLLSFNIVFVMALVFLFLLNLFSLLFFLVLLQYCWFIKNSLLFWILVMVSVWTQYGKIEELDVLANLVTDVAKPIATAHRYNSQERGFLQQVFLKLKVMGKFSFFWNSGVKEHIIFVCLAQHRCSLSERITSFWSLYNDFLKGNFYNDLICNQICICCICCVTLTHYK